MSVLPVPPKNTTPKPLVRRDRRVHGHRRGAGAVVLHDDAVRPVTAPFCVMAMFPASLCSMPRDAGADRELVTPLVVIAILRLVAPLNIALMPVPVEKRWWT